MRAAFVRFGYVVSALLAVSTACRDSTGPEERDFLRARALWRSHALPNYDYTLRRECFCPTEFTQAIRVQVRAGIVVGATATADGSAIDVSRVVTIDQIFDDIERTLDRGTVLGASYDDVYGFPVEARLDRITNAIDDEGAFFLSDFQIRTG